GLTPAATNNGVQIAGSFTVGLADPGTLAQDGRISIDELNLPNPSPTQPGFKINPAGGGSAVTIADTAVVKIADTSPRGSLNQFIVTLQTGTSLTGIANGDGVSYVDSGGHTHTGTLAGLDTTVPQFTVQYSI